MLPSPLARAPGWRGLERQPGREGAGQGKREKRETQVGSSMTVWTLGGTQLKPILHGLFCWSAIVKRESL